MQYTITINQFAVIQAGLNLDVIDLSIFDYIKDYAHSPKCLKLQTENGAYFWVSHKAIINNLPILGITTNVGIIKRINKLIDAGILVRHPDCELLKKTFYRFGPNYDKLLFTLNENLQPLTNVYGSINKSLEPTINESLGEQLTIKQKTIYQDNIPAGGGLFPSETIIEPVKGTHLRRTAELSACLFANSRYADFQRFDAEFTAPEFAEIDIAYYYHAVADWSAQKGKKMKDWIATARNFIRSDMEKGKLHRLPGSVPSLDPDAMEYLKDMAD